MFAHCCGGLVLLARLDCIRDQLMTLKRALHSARAMEGEASIWLKSPSDSHHLFGQVLVPTTAIGRLVKGFVGCIVSLHIPCFQIRERYVVK